MLLLRSQSMRRVLFKGWSERLTSQCEDPGMWTTCGRMSSQEPPSPPLRTTVFMRVYSMLSVRPRVWNTCHATQILLVAGLLTAPCCS